MAIYNAELAQSLFEKVEQDISYLNRGSFISDADLSPVLQFLQLCELSDLNHNILDLIDIMSDLRVEVNKYGVQLACCLYDSDRVKKSKESLVSL